MITIKIPEPYFTVGFKPFVFILSLIPLGLLVQGFFQDTLGANPIETITRDTGEWTLRFLVFTLLISSLRRQANWAQTIRLRRMLGLFTFFYGFLHLMTYLWLDQFFFWEDIVLDIVNRPFITVGMLAFLLLIPLAVTSTNAMVRRLKKNWVKLHKLVYVVAILGVLHFFWLTKADYFEPVLYLLIFMLLFLERMIVKASR